MRRLNRLKRDEKLLKFLSTPVIFNGELLKTKHGELIYPTLEEAALKFDLTIETISRKTHAQWDKFQELKNENAQAEH